MTLAFSELASSSTGLGGPSSKLYSRRAGWIITSEFITWAVDGGHLGLEGEEG